MKKTSTKRSLIMSLLSMVICIVMLIGSTFAWFTDSAVFENNVIKAGNLDMEVEYSLDGKEWKSLDGAEDLFSKGLWEPGHTEVVALKIENKGTLTFKYNVNMNIASEVEGTNVYGEAFKLSEILEVSTYVMDGGAPGDALIGGFFKSEEGYGYTAPVAFKSAELIQQDMPVLANDTGSYVVIKVDMPETVGNEANYKTGTTAPSINFGVNVVATQFTSENDTFGSQYDKDAEYPNLVFDSKDVNEKLEDGENVIFADDVEAPLSNKAIYGTPVAIQQKNGGVIDGNGKSLDIINPEYNGYAIETYGGTIKNLIIDSTVGRGIVISNPKEDIYISNVVVDGPGYAINTTEHNGKKLVVTNSTVKGWTSLAGLDSVSFVNCIFGENTSKYWQENGYDQDYDRLIRPYILAEFNQCVFEKGFYIDLSALGSDCIITLDKCTVNGVVLTADNYEGNITIELPSGRTVADCVIFK